MVGEAGHRRIVLGQIVEESFQLFGREVGQLACQIALKRRLLRRIQMHGLRWPRRVGLAARIARIVVGGWRRLVWHARCRVVGWRHCHVLDHRGRLVIGLIERLRHVVADWRQLRVRIQIGW